MAVLSDADRTETSRKFIQAYFVGLAQRADLDTVELRQLVDDIDAWLDSQTAAANSAIRAVIRAKASTNTKFAALAYVALKRAALL